MKHSAETEKKKTTKTDQALQHVSRPESTAPAIGELTDLHARDIGAYEQCEDKCIRFI